MTMPKTPAATLKTAAVTARLIATCPHCQHESPEFIQPEESLVEPGVVGCWNCCRTFLVDAPASLDASVALTLSLSATVASSASSLIKSTAEAVAVATVRRAVRKGGR